MTTELALVPQPDEQPFRPFLCPRCKFDITSPEMHGWLRLPFGPETGWKTQTVPCDLCSQPAIAQRKAEEIERMFGQSMLPIYAREWSFSTTPGDVDQRALARCANFANMQLGEARGLYIFGEPGGGKTGLAISIMQAVMARGIDAAFIRTITLMNRLREAIARGTRDGDRLLHLVENVRWLALDDLAVERPTEYVIEQLYAIIEERRSCGLYTVITSNYNLKELEARWRPDDVRAGAFHAGKRVLERISEYCLGVPVRGRNERRTSPEDGKVKAMRGK